jgi:hypothetical protein
MSEITEESLAKPAELSKGQAGVVARRQLTELGIGRPYVRSHLRGKQWRRELPGVFATFTGPLPDLARGVGGSVVRGTRCRSKSSDGRLAERPAA